MMGHTSPPGTGVEAESLADQALFQTLTAAIRPLADPVAIVQTTLALLGQHLDANRVIYFDVRDGDYIIGGNFASGVAEVQGRYPTDTFGQAVLQSCASGQNAVSDDIHTDPNVQPQDVAAFAGISIRAFIGVPLIKGGQFIAGLAVHSSTPRAWTDSQIRLVRDVADRIWSAVMHANAEADLRIIQDRRAFLLTVTEALRTLDNPGAIQATACRLLSERFDVDRAFYVEIDEVAGYGIVSRDHARGAIRSMAGQHRLEGFGWCLNILRRGECPLITDSRLFPQLPLHDRMMMAAMQMIGCMAAPLLKGGRLVGALCVTSSTPREWTETEQTLLIDVGERIWAAIERDSAEALQRVTENRFRTLAEGIPQMVWRGAADGQWTWVSPQWTAFTGQSEPDSLGWAWLQSVHMDDRQAVTSAWDRAGSSGQFEADCRLHDVQAGEYRWFQARALPVRDQQGVVIEWLGTSTDVQDLRESQDRLRTLVAELQHRTRNMMAVVNAVTERTLATSGNLQEFRMTIRSRLGAISRATSLLSRLEGNGRVSFDELVQSVFLGHGVDPQDPERGIVLAGPGGVSLRSSAVQTLSLALHELMAEALDHGALSVPAGRLTLNWSLQTDDSEVTRLIVNWQERPPHPMDESSPEAGGFARELIERALPYQLSAETVYDVSARGLDCKIIMPISARTS